MVSTHLEICSSKLDHFSKFSVCKKHIWNHHLVHYCNHISATWLWLWNVGLWNVENIHPFVFWSPQTNPSCLMSVSRVSPGLFLKPIVRGSMGGTVSLSTWMFDFFMVNSQQKQGLFMGKHYKTRVDKHPTNFLSRIASYTAKLCEQHNILKEFHDLPHKKISGRKTATPLSSLTWQTGKSLFPIGHIHLQELVYVPAIVMLVFRGGVYRVPQKTPMNFTHHLQGLP